MDMINGVIENVKAVPTQNRHVHGCVYSWQTDAARHSTILPAW
jgi:hypothetical protein